MAASSNMDFRNESSKLDFQEFTFDSADRTEPPPQYEEHQVTPETEDLLPGDEKKGQSFWEFAYYQSFFDVNTDQVVRRIVWSMIPLPGRATFLHRCIKPTPDLYGPFWICATLVMAIAMGGNIADYLHSAGKQDKWHYDFHKVSLAATTIYSYTSLVPLALWGFFWYRRSQAGYSLTDLICLYGYSMSIYVPIALLCVLQFWWLQWTLVLLGAILSAAVLLLTLWPAVKDDTKKVSLIVLLLVLVLHIALATGFLTYFFQPSHNAASSVINPATPVPKNFTLPDIKPDLPRPQKLQSQNQMKDLPPSVPTGAPPTGVPSTGTTKVKHEQVPKPTTQGQQNSTIKAIKPNETKTTSDQPIISKTAQPINQIITNDKQNVTR